jgi:predicted RNase H-like nuclease (RuvC/YqgF family)
LDNTRKDASCFIGDEDTGFLGKFTVYASANNVEELVHKKEGVKYTVRKSPIDSPVIRCNKFEEKLTINN